jgi:hypothetical protein
LVNYRKLYLQTFLVAIGQIPHPQATIPMLETAIKTSLIQMGARLGTYVYDPEIPDNLLAVIVPALMTRGVKPDELSNVAGSLTELGTSGGTPSGTIATTAKEAETENLIDNLQDVGDRLINFDIPGVFEEGLDVFGDLFSGGGIFGPG